MAAAAAEKESAPAAPEGGGAPAGGGGGGKLVLILTGVNVLATLSMVGILFISFQKEKNAAKVGDIATQAAGEHGEAAKDGGGGEHGAPAKEGGEHGGGDAHGGGEKKAAKKSADFGKMVTLDQFTVNLSTPGSAAPKFVRVNVAIEMANDEAENEVTSKMPQVRNAIIDLFNSKRPADLATADGRDYLKEEIRNALNGFLVTGKVKGVFFTNFALSS